MSEIIYKYLPPERDTYLQNELLRFTQPSDLNDPFECIPAMPSIDETKKLIEEVFALRKEEINKLKNISKANRKELLNQTEIQKKTQVTNLLKSPFNIRTNFFKDAQNNINSKIGIFSLSRRWNSTLMWSHYCLSHKGFCIGFDKNHTFFSSGTFGGSTPVSLKPVIYSNRRTELPMKQNELIDFNVMFTKSADWSYEEEERLLAMFTFSNEIIKQTPFNIYLFRVPHNIIREVIVGANASIELKEKIKHFAEKIDVPFYKSVIHESEFDMQRILT